MKKATHGLTIDQMTIDYLDISFLLFGDKQLVLKLT